MKRLIASSLIVLGCTSAAFCEQVLREISWSKLKEAGRSSAGEIQQGGPPGPTEQLKIVNAEDRRKVVTVLRIDSPGITSSRYAVHGQVRCEGVQGKGYLEMWSCFADGGEYFSRTLGRYGPMRKLEGSCGWRPFVLPFFITEGTARPETLVINVVLPGRGTVYLGPLRLLQYSQAESPTAAAGQWWDEQTAGMVGGIGGAVLGCLGGLIGTLAGLGKAGRFVLALSKAIFLFGFVLLAGGLVALSQSQPYAVYYPLLLGGVICTVVMGGTLPALRRRYEQDELRKIASMDAARGPAPVDSAR